MVKLKGRREIDSPGENSAFAGCKAGPQCCFREDRESSNLFSLLSLSCFDLWLQISVWMTRHYKEALGAFVGSLHVSKEGERAELGFSLGLERHCCLPTAPWGAQQQAGEVHDSRQVWSIKGILTVQRGTVARRLWSHAPSPDTAVWSRQWVVGGDFSWRLKSWQMSKELSSLPSSVDMEDF